MQDILDENLRSPDIKRRNSITNIDLSFVELNNMNLEETERKNALIRLDTVKRQNLYWRAQHQPIKV